MTNEFTLTIRTTGSAFDDPNAEVGRILAKLSTRISYGLERDNGVVQDLNGNTAGEWTLDATRDWSCVKCGESNPGGENTCNECGFYVEH
jgi:hypothetical protein